MRLNLTTALITALAFAPCSEATAGTVTVPNGQTGAGLDVYWIDASGKCNLNGHAISVTANDLPVGVEFVLKPGDVTTNQCGNRVPGHHVMLKVAKSVPSGSYSFNAVVKYAVNDGTNGYSSHFITLIVP